MDFALAQFYLPVAWTGTLYSGMSKRSRVALYADPNANVPVSAADTAHTTPPTLRTNEG